MLVINGSKITNMLENLNYFNTSNVSNQHFFGIFWIYAIRYFNTSNVSNQPS